MTKYIPIEAILNNFPESLRNEVGDTTLVSFALEGYDMLGLPEQHETKIQFFEIIDYKLELPDDIMEINYVTYMASEPEDCDCQALASACGAPEVLDFETRSNEICNYTINYKIFLDSPLYNKNFKPLKYVGTLNRDSLCGNCKNRFCHDCSETFAIDKNRMLWTSLQEGFLCIEYAARMEQDGSLMIIDDPKIKRFLRLYAIAMSLQDRDLQDGNTKYIQYNREAEMALKAAKGRRILRGIDPNFVSEISFTQTANQKFIRNPKIYSK